MSKNLGPFHPLSYPTKVDYGDREVVIRTTVTVETRTSTKRLYYDGMTEAQILEYEGKQETDTLLEDFVKDVESTPAADMVIVRTVAIEDKK